MAAVVLTDWRTTMASHGGTIRPVSPLASHTLETVLSLEHQIAASSKKSSELSVSPRSQTVRKRYLTAALAALFALLCVSSSRLDAQSTCGSVRATVQDSSCASLPATHRTLHS